MTNNLEELFRAIDAGDRKQVNRLSKEGEINTTLENGVTPLMISTKAGQLEITKKLLEAGAEVEATNEKGKTALEIAIRNQNPQLINLLRNYGAEYEPDKTDLMQAVFKGDDDKFQAELKKSQAINKKDADGHTPLIWATKFGDLQQVKALVKNGADLEKETARGQTALFYACKQEAEKIAKFLIDQGAQVNNFDNLDFTPLMISKNINIVKLLVESGAEVNYETEHGFSPLGIAASRGDSELVEYFLENLDLQQTEDNGFKPLKNAITNQNQAVIQQLLEAGVDPNYKDNVALDYAIKEGEEELIRLLKDYEAQYPEDKPELLKSIFEADDNKFEFELSTTSVNKSDPQGITPLVWASYFGNVDYVEKLIQAGAKVNYQAEEIEVTPLMIAASTVEPIKGHKQVIKILLKEEALTSDEFKKIVQVANKREIRDFLREKVVKKDGN
ncbi:ankyrin repeat domain-containing protein [Halanaerobacter jeridensis]|uniref:Ankyrin repeat protein n=1 Tax=Halanaerobacter jeridensis TaxID=706427 RepID=A0A939BQ75_9FIRM|nr:ankyrin repeat domain-containing protein [Halanaerobacter jeridensis]MBM7557798.1 ankyrin repeat protein [Halanaerobacter jeridensis]